MSCSAKYPLALINRLLDILGNHRISGGYDIACAFWKTLMASSIAPKAREKDFHMIVGSFHGHAHNRGCQVNWHPLYRMGSGRADYEGCEWVFYCFNDLAPETHHSSKVRRFRAIEEHMRFWDEDKYAGLCESFFKCSLTSLTL